MSDNFNLHIPMFMNANLKAVAYIRVSTEGQVEDVTYTSLDSQRAYILDYAAKHGIEIVEIFSDKKSAKDNDRPGLKKLINRIKQGDISILIAHRFDRITRDIVAYRDFANLLAHYRVKEIYTNDLNVDANNPEGRYIKDISVLNAGFEREKTSLRIKSKMKSATMEGYYASGQPPVGYLRNRETKILEIDPVAKTHIEFIFREYLGDVRPAEIAQKMMSRQWKTPLKSNKKRCIGGKYYTEQLVSRILENPIYAGNVYRFNEQKEMEVYPGKHEAIIPQADWDKAEAIRISRKNGKTYLTRTRILHALKGKLYCSCGQQMTMVSTSKKRSDGTPYQHYVCTKKRAERSTCDCNTSISKSVIEGVFFATLMHLAKGNISKKDVASQQKQYGLDLEKELKVLNNSEKAKKQELANLTKALSSLKPSSPLAKSLLETMQPLSEELEEIRLRKAEINKQLSIMEEIVDLDSLQLDSSLNNLDLLFEEMTEEEKILLVSTVVEKISLKVESVDVRKKYYTIMITPTLEYFSKLGVQVVEFCYDNSKGS